MNYETFGQNEGCCLKCDEAEPGCLCFDGAVRRAVADGCVVVEDFNK